MDEVGSDPVDFNIQRLGLWLRYNQKSAISKAEWEELQVQALPKLTGKLTVGIKYGKDGDSVAMSIAVRTADGSVFVEAIDCRPVRAGNDWLLDFLSAADIDTVVIDGANGQQLLADSMKQRKLKAPLLPSVNQIILANSTFVMEGMTNHRLCHMGQPSLAQVISNCEKRAIGSNGGFGYKSILDGAKIELMESMILAFWKCSETKVKRKQKIRY